MRGRKIIIYVISFALILGICAGNIAPLPVFAKENEEVIADIATPMVAEVEEEGIVDISEEKYGSDDYSLRDYKFTVPSLRDSSKNITFDGNDGKYKVIIYGALTSCLNTDYAVRTIAELASNIDMKQVDIYFFDGGSDKAEAKMLLNSYDGKNKIKDANGLDRNNALLEIFAKIDGFPSADDKSISPTIAYVDNKGNLVNVSHGFADRTRIILDMLDTGIPLNAEYNLTTVNVTGKTEYTEAYKVLDLLNKERVAVGADPLIMDEKLLQGAMQRAAELTIVFDHVRPDGTDCLGVVEGVSGENIAMGQNDATDVMKSWMSSSGHRRNILNSGYKTAGIGAFEHNGKMYWVQLFGVGAANKASTNKDSEKKFAISGYINLDSLNVRDFCLDKGKNVDLPYVCYQGSTLIDSDSFDWSSSDPRVVKIANGKLTGVDVGRVVITVKSKSNAQITFSFIVTVNEPIIEDVNLNSFSDKAFRKYLADNYDKDKDNIIKAKDVTKIDIRNNVEISNIEGIGLFYNLTDLDCGRTSISKLDVSNNFKLSTVACDSNPSLTSLVLPQNNGLIDVDCANTKLTSLDLKGNENLESLYINNTDIKEIDITKLKHLKALSVDYDCKIDISNCKLFYMNIYVNSVKGIIDFNSIPGIDKKAISDDGFDKNTGKLSYYITDSFGYKVATSQFTDNEDDYYWGVIGLYISYDSKYIDVEDWWLNEDELILEEGKNENLVASFNPSNATDKAIIWSSDDETIATVDSNGKVTAKKEGETYINASLRSKTWMTKTCKITVKKKTPDKPIIAPKTADIYIHEMSKDIIIAGLVTDVDDTSNLEYSWLASSDGGSTWETVSDWRIGHQWLDWTPDKWGDYKIIGKVRVKGDASTTLQATAEVSYHPHIKGKCQMPYVGEQGIGYLIGVESYDNPDQKYQYEMLILDCTLLAQGLPAWTYTTGQFRVPEGNAGWCIWTPQYGYYWTLFRVYDENGVQIDEECFGFANIC